MHPPHPPLLTVSPWALPYSARTKATDERERRLYQLAARNLGLFTNGDARRLGIPPDWISRRVGKGLIDRVHPGVWRIAGAPVTWRSRQLAAALWVGNHGASGRRAAARLWKLRGDWPGLAELTTTRGRHRPSREVVVHYTRLLEPGDMTRIEGIPVTTISRTLADLAAVTSRDRLSVACDDALRRGQVSTTQLRRELFRLQARGRNGIVAFREEVEARPLGYIPLHGEFERRLADVLESSSLPEPKRQYQIVDPAGNLVGKVDFAFPEARLAVEADSYTWHAGKEEWKRDIRRRNALRVLGWEIYEVIWDELVARPWQIVSDIAALLSERTLAGPDF